MPALIEAFNGQVPPPGERGGDLALEKEFHEWRRTTSSDFDARRAALIRSYLATETERQGHYRLSGSQSRRVAAHYDEFGEAFLALGLPGHAALAFQAAAELYDALGQKARRNHSLLSWRRAQHLTRPPGAFRLFDGLYDEICGYGYRPFRMLGWMAVMLAVFSVAVCWAGSSGYLLSLHACLIDFLNPLGFGDLEGRFSGTGQVLLTLESYLGSISMAIFFAFLVRD
jgi:hypothetical protein